MPAGAFTPSIVPFRTDHAQGKLEHKATTCDFLGNRGAHGNHQKRDGTQFTRRSVVHHLVVALFKRGKHGQHQREDVGDDHLHRNAKQDDAGNAHERRAASRKPTVSRARE